MTDGQSERRLKRIVPSLISHLHAFGKGCATMLGGARQELKRHDLPLQDLG
jgi:hypothetical protein